MLSMHQTWHGSEIKAVIATCMLSGLIHVCTLQAFNLVDSKELVPLQELIDQMVS